MNPDSAKQAFIITCLTVLTATLAAQTTALDDYVAAPDPTYDWQLRDASLDLSSFSYGYVLELTSQTWRTPSEVDHTVWKHWVRVFMPALGDINQTALLFINDGSHLDPMPPTKDQFGLIAFATNSVIVELNAVPNQPLLFAGEPNSRTEDEIIAYSWEKYLDGGDDYWPVQLPMVKAVVKCMDAVGEFVAAETGDPDAATSFLVAGGSKRGWTSWLTAAVDTRVVAVAPVVIDLLNMKRSFAHHWAAYGFWAEALKPYQDSRIFDRFDEPRATDLLSIVDPFAYLDRLTMPKFIVNAAGDDFFVMDSLQFYIDDLLGETHVRVLPNADHYLSNGKFQEALDGAVPYYYDLLNDIPRPQYSWTVEDDGSIVVQTADTPKEVKLWQAHNPDTRDFRLTTIGPTWTDSPLTEQSPGVYVAAVDTPAQGWTAFFVELTYDNDFSDQFSTAGEYDYRFTTEIRVLPETCPFETDFTRDRQTDLADLAILSDHWLNDSPYRDIIPRRTGDGIINIHELAIFAKNWLKTP